MARTPKGKVEKYKGKSGTTYRTRIQVNGKRRSVVLGHGRDGMTEALAEQHAQNLVADARRGLWHPIKPEPVPDVDPDPSFWQFASDWFEATRSGLAENTVKDYRWQLDHLLVFFHAHALSEISVAEVDRFTHSKLRQATLGPASVNKLLTRLGQILEVAVEYELITRNPVRVGKRKVKVPRFERDYLDNAEHVLAVLRAAGELDSEARADRRGARRALVAVLMFGGLRISEACALRWRHVDLAAGRLRVPGTKTDAAARWVRLLPVLRDELAAHKANSRSTGPDDLVLPTARGTARTKDNARQRVWGPVIERANSNLTKRDLTPLPHSITMHSARKTCCSVRLAMGEDLAYVAEQLGHADTSVTHRYYLRVMRMGPGDRERLRALVAGGVQGLSDAVEISGNDRRRLSQLP
ncbi:MAG: tyrosine-type recombinase/integrase [Solirubrobacteraceae bacterium]